MLTYLSLIQSAAESVRTNHMMLHVIIASLVNLCIAYNFPSNRLQFSTATLLRTSLPLVMKVCNDTTER